MREHTIEELFDCLNDLKSASERVPMPPEGMNRAEMHVLYSIYTLSRELPVVKVTDISRKLGIQSPNVIALVKKLEQQELVTKCADNKDKRVVHVALTEAGVQLVNGHVLEYYQRLSDVFKDEDEELQLLIRSLRRLGRRIEKTKTLFIEELGGEAYE